MTQATYEQWRNRNRLRDAAYAMKRNGGVPALRLRKRMTRDHAAGAWAAHWRCSQASGRRAASRLWTSNTISIETADRWCVALGTHLAIVYPEAYYEAWSA